MSKETFFFDTYALIEIIKGNPKYEIYTNATIITSIFNLAELNYILKKEHPKEVADRITAEYKPFAIKVLFEDITSAMDLKSKFRELSIPDVIGYTIAERQAVKFLTGDEGFKSLPNVEFVKK